MLGPSSSSYSGYPPSASGAQFWAFLFGLGWIGVVKTARARMKRALSGLGRRMWEKGPSKNVSYEVGSSRR